MTYSDKLALLSRQSLNIVELDLDTTITEGGTEYLCEGLVPHGQKFWPCVTKIEYAPTKASDKGGLGQFGEVVITCTDFNWPGGNGTYFGRLLASNPYYLNRVLKVHVGFHSFGDTFSFGDTQERRYFIKKITGPDQKGQVKIEAADVLTQLKESTAPAVSNGNLAAALNSTDTVLTDIGDNDGFSASGGYAIINDEIVAYSGVTGSDSITISSRGQGGTTADSHDAGDPVRHIYQYTGNCVDCIRDLIEYYSEIDHATYIPDTEWNTERDTYLATEDVEIWETEPVTLDKIIDKIGQQTYLNCWWDDASQEIKVKAIGPTLTSSTAWNGSEHVLDEKVIIVRDQRKIVTQVWIYYGKIDQTGNDDAENYEKLRIQIDSDAETALGQPKVVTIFADYLGTGASAIASKIASRIISQNSNPLAISLYVDAKDSALNVGDPVDLSTDLLQGTDGLPVTTKLRVIEKAQRSNNKYQYKMVFSGVEQGNRYAVIAPNSILDYDSESTANQNKYAWIADSSNKVGVADDDPYLIL